MKKLYIFVSLLLIFTFVLSGCSNATEAPKDKLEEILALGTLIVSTDPGVPTLNTELVEGATPVANTKCTGDQKTASEMKGFDIDVRGCHR